MEDSAKVISIDIESPEDYVVNVYLVIEVTTARGLFLKHKVLVESAISYRGARGCAERLQREIRSSPPING